MSQTTDEWLDTELWNFAHALAIALNLNRGKELELHQTMAAAIIAHEIWKETK